METGYNFTSIGFIAITFLTIGMFYLASNKNNKALLIICVFALLQAIAAKIGFFDNKSSIPPRFLFLILPNVILILSVFYTQKGKEFISSLNLTTLTYLHTIRIAVEFAIFSLFLMGLMPKILSFEGQNFDILSGITAPIIAYFGFQKAKISQKGILIWNILALMLVIQVVICGLLSAPTPIQQICFDTPNVAVIMFPYVWLPGIVVPIVIFSHIVTINKLMNKK